MNNENYPSPRIELNQFNGIIQVKARNGLRTIDSDQEMKSMLEVSIVSQHISSIKSTQVNEGRVNWRDIISNSEWPTETTGTIQLNMDQYVRPAHFSNDCYHCYVTAYSYK